MDLVTGICLFIAGLLAGGYGTIVGAGGGFIFVPALLILFNVDPVYAAGSGLVIVLINSLSGVTGYARQKRIDYKVGIRIGLGAIPGSFAGVWLLQFQSDSRIFFWMFATVLVGLGVFLFIKNFSSKQSQETVDVHEGKIERSPLEYRWFLPIGLFMGVLSSFLGIGGGWLLVPILIYLFRFTAHAATATSIFSLCLYTSTGVLLQVFYQNIDWAIVLWGGFGIIFGAQIGVMLSKKVSSQMIVQMLSVVLIVMGVRMYFG